MRSTGSDKYKHRQLTMWDYLPRDTAEREEITEVCESPRMTETDITNRAKQTEGLLEQILTDENLEKAYRQVKKNKGAGGIDGMQVDKLLPYLRENQKTGNTDRRGPTDPTGDRSDPDTDLRAEVLGQQLRI